MKDEDAPSDFKIPISRVRSRTAVYIAIETTMNPTMTATAMTTPIKLRNRPMLLIESSEVNSSIV